MFGFQSIKLRKLSRFGKLCVAVLLVALMFFDTVSTGMLTTYAYSDSGGKNSSTDPGGGTESDGTTGKEGYVYTYNNTYMFMQNSAHYFSYYDSEGKRTMPDTANLFDLVSTEGGNEFAAFCGDITIRYKKGVTFKQLTLENAIMTQAAHFYKQDGTEYTEAEARAVARKLREIVYAAYPFIDADYVNQLKEDGEDPTESILSKWIEKMEEKNQAYDGVEGYKAIDTDKFRDANGKITLTLDEALTATQLAIWRYTNENIYIADQPEKWPQYFGTLSSRGKAKFRDPASQELGKYWYEDEDNNSENKGKKPGKDLVYETVKDKDDVTYRRYDVITDNIKSLFDWLTSLGGEDSHAPDIRMKSSAKVAGGKMEIQFKLYDKQSGEPITIDEDKDVFQVEVLDSRKTPINGINYKFGKRGNAYYVSVPVTDERIDKVNVTVQKNEQGVYEDIFYYIPSEGSEEAQSFIGPGTSPGGGVASVSYKKANTDKEIELYKVYKNQYLEIPLEGAVFSLYKQFGEEPDSENDILIASDIVTDADGKAKVSGLEKSATYYFIEEKAPDGYEQINGPITVDGESVTVENQPDGEYNIKLFKHEKGSKSQPISGVKFELYMQNGDCDVENSEDTEKDILIGSFTTDDNGYLEVKGLPYGDYYFIEVEAPGEYIIDTKPHKFTVSKDTPVNDEGYMSDVEVANESVKAHIKLEKQDRVTKYVDENGNEVPYPVTNAKFTIYHEAISTDKDYRDSVYDRDETKPADANGIVLARSFPARKYYIVESTVPEGYVDNSDYEIRYFFTISREDNGKYVSIDKVGYYTKDGTLMKDESGKEMYYDYTDWRDTSYTDGNGVLHQEIRNVVKNDQIRGNIKVIKKDEKTEELLSGAVFELYYIDENGVKKVVDPVKTTADKLVTVVYGENGQPAQGYTSTLTTDETGVIQFNDIPYGHYVKNGSGVYEYKKLTYYIREVKAPKGYVLREHSESFEITKNGYTYEYNATNKKMTGKLEINKILQNYEYIKNLDLDKIKFSITHLDDNGQTVSFTYKDSNGDEKTVNELVVSLADFEQRSITEQQTELYYCLDGIDLGTYKVKELDGTAFFKITAEGKDGYTETDELTFNVYSDGTYIPVIGDASEDKDYKYEATLSFNFKNEYKLGNFNIIKYGKPKPGENYTDLSSDELTVLLSGVKFDIYRVTTRDEDGSVKTAEYVTTTPVTDSSGRTSVKDLPYGDYYYIEKENPNINYVTDGDKHEFTVNDNAVNATYDLDNYRKTVNLKIRKLSENHVVDGIPFKIFGTTVFGERIRIIQRTTANGGFIDISDLPIGNYTIMEDIDSDKNGILGPYVIPGIQTITADQMREACDSGTTLTFSFTNNLKRGTLKVEKYDADSSNKVGIPNVKFELYQKINPDYESEYTGVREISVDGDDTVKVVYYGEYITDENGFFTVKDLPYGTYYCRETSAPEGYVYNSEKYYELPFEISNAGDVMTLEKNIPNKQIVGQVKIKKTDENGNALQGAKFKLVYADGTNAVDINGKTVAEQTTNADGVCTFDNIPYGIYVDGVYTKQSYYAVETEAPYGYVTSEYGYDKVNGKNIAFGDIIPVEITENGKTYEITRVNKEIKGKLIIEKKIAESIYKNVSSDVDWTEFTFRITGVDSKGNEITFDDGNTYLDVNFEKAHPEDTKTENGIKYVYQTLEVSDLKLGTYTIEEICDETVWEPQSSDSTEIKVDGKITDVAYIPNADVKFKNEFKTNYFKLRKIDAVTEKALSGVKFGIYTSADESAKVIEGTTGEDGILVIEGIPYGTYYYKETLPLPNYIADNEFKQFTVSADDMVTVTAENDREEYDYKIIKKIEEINKFENNLAGFYFRITGTNVFGEKVDITVGPTDAEGKLSDLNGNKLYKADENGYTVTEILNDEQSEVYRTPEPQKAVLNGKTYKVTFENAYKKAALLLRKIDKESGKPINGVKFGIYKYENEEYTELATGVTADITVGGKTYQGAVYFDNLPINATYYYKELSVPKDFDGEDKYIIDTEYHEFTFDEDNQMLTPAPIENSRETYSLKLTKTAEDQNETGFEFKDKFEFRITGTNIYGEAVDITVKTNADGVASVTGLYKADEKGYTVEEINISEKYIPPRPITLTKINENNEYVNEDGTNAAFYNEVKKGTLKLLKYEMLSGKQTPVEGAKFAVYTKVVYKIDENGNEVVDTDNSVLYKYGGHDGYYVTNAQGCIDDVEGLVYGTYYYQEVEAPKGYVLDSTVYEFKIEHFNEVVERTLENKRIYAKIQIAKTTDVAGGRLSGFEFEIKGVYDIPDENGNTEYSKTFTTNTQGYVTADTIGYLPAGEYTVTELRNNVSQQFIMPASQTEIIDANKNLQTITFNFENITVKKQLQLFKYEAYTGKKLPLADTEFTFSGEGFPSPNVRTTDENGMIIVDDIPYGEYTFKETKAAQGYATDKTLYKFTVDNNWDENDETTKIIKAEVVNEPLKAALKIIKTADGKTKGNLAGFEFLVEGETLIKEDDKEGPDYSQKFVTDANGEISIDNLPYGTYTITELTTNTSLPYVIDKDKIKINGSNDNVTFEDGIITVDLYGDKTVEIHNRTKEGKFRITKVDADTGEKLAGAVFKITDANNKSYEVTSGADGIAEINLPYGSYTYTEIKAPDGYILDSVGGRFDIEKDGQIVSVELKNTMAKIKLCIKKTSETGIVQGFKFLVEGETRITSDDKDGPDYSEVFTTDENGEIVLDDMPVGTYKVTELESGLTKDFVIPDPEEVKIDEDGNVTSNDDRVVDLGEVVVFNFYNKLRRISAEITKTDIVDDTPLPNTGIRIIDENDNVVVVEYTDEDGASHTERCEGYTDENGKIVFHQLLPGTYYYQEFDAPDGYLIDTTPHEFTVTEDGEVYKATMKDKREIGKLKIIKTSQTGKVEGFTFRITGVTDSKVDNDFSAEVTTDKTGILLIDVPAGEYTVEELPYGDAKNYIIPEPQTKRVDNDTTVEFEFYNDLKDGSVEITKTDIVTDEPLPNTGIRIIDENGNVIELDYIDENGNSKHVRYEGYTDEDGKLTFHELPLGTYYYQEFDAPDGYMIDETPHEFTINENGQTVKATMKDKRSVGDIKLIKKSEDGKVDNIKFRVTGETFIGEPFEPMTVTTEKDGTIKIDNLLAGKYTFEELEIEGLTDDYVLPQIKTIIIPDGNSEEYTKPFEIEFYNILKRRGYVEITKVDIVDDTPLPNTRIRITDENGETVTAGYIDENGEIKFRLCDGYTDENGIIKFMLPAGNYYYQEVEAPEGYLIDTKPYPFTVTDDGITKAVMKDKRATAALKIVKTSDSGKVDGFKFLITGTTLIGEEFKPMVVTTENGGIINIDNLLLGTYTIKELEIAGVTDPYVLPKPQTIKIEDYGKTYKVNFFNKLKTGTFDFTKTDFVDDTPLPDTGIRITDEDGNVVFEGYTDENGKIVIKLPVGTYYYQEFDAPKGYQLDENPYKFTIKDDGEVVKAVMKDLRIPTTGDATNTDLLLLMMLASMMFIFMFMSKKHKETQKPAYIEAEGYAAEAQNISDVLDMSASKGLESFDFKKCKKSI